ncbi:MAG: hypothetical protein ABSA05_15275, partial [Opitutaceae bacterium]
MHTRRLSLALISLLPASLCFAQTNLSGTDSDSSGNVTLSGTYRLTGDTTLSGANAFIMSGVPSVPSGVVFGTDGNGRTLFNQTTVEGSGLVGGNPAGVSQNLTINNSGTFNANSSGNTLELAGSGGTLTNTGFLEATSGGILLLAPSGGAINNAGGTLSASGSGSTVQLNATLQGGTLSTSSGGVIQTQGTATLDGSTGAGAITITDGSAYTAGGTSSTTTTTNLAGTLNLGTVTGGALSAGGFLRLVNNETLAGPGSVTLAGGQIGTDGNGRTLTVGSSNTIQGYGFIGSNASATGGNPSLSANLQLTNSGTINANVNGNSLTLGGSGGTMTNSGLFEATNGGILIVAPTGGVVSDGSGTITAAGSGSTVEINSTIQGGTLTTSGGGLMETVTSATLDGSNGTNGAVTISNGSTYTSVTNTTTNVLGTLNLGTSGSGGTLSVNGLLRMTGNETLAGPGVVTLSNGQIGTDGNGRTLFNESTIQGQGVIGSNASGVSQNMALDNTGTVDANVTSGMITLSSTGGTTTNSGTFEATNGGILLLEPSNGPINNNGGNISAVGSGSTVQITASVQGGTLNTSGGGLMETTGTATLDGSTSNGTVTISNGSTYTAPTSTTTNVLGTLNLGTSGSGGTLSVNGLLRMTGNETLAGPGVVTMTNGQIGTDGNGRTLNNQSIIQGTGVIGSNASGVSQNMVLNNSGTVDANVTSGTITLSSTGGTTTNSGTFEATNGGALVLAPTNGPINNNGGAITANGSGSTVQIESSIQGGTLNTQSGGVVESVGVNLATLDGSTANGADTISDGSTYTAATGTQTNVLGTLNLGTVTGGTLALGGNLRLLNTETLSGPGDLVMTGGQIGTDGNGRTLVNNSTIEGSGVIGSNVSGISNNLTTTNNGTILANQSGTTLQIAGTNGVSNAGTFQANAGSTLWVTSSLGNFSGNTLSGGSYVVNAGTIQVNSFGNNVAGEIVNTSSNITLNGSNASTLLEDAGDNNALMPLANIQTGGNVTVEGGYNFTTAGALTNAGTVHAGNNGTFTATDAITGTTGKIQIDSGGTVSIAGGSTPSTVGTLTQNGT